MAINHTFDDSCLLKEQSNTFTRRASSVAIDAPKITAQFFYCSALPIDDPLAAVPLPSSSSASRSSKVPPRPFSVLDNIALEQAWLKLQNARQTEVQQSELQPARSGIDKHSTANPFSKPDVGENTSHAGEEVTREDTPQSDNIRAQPIIPQKVIKRSKDRVDLEFQPGHHIEGHPPTSAIPPHVDFDNTTLEETVPVSTEEIVHDENESGIPDVRRSRSFFHRKDKGEKPTEDIESPRSSVRKLSRGGQEEGEGVNIISKSPDTTGTPFLRAPPRTRKSRSTSPIREAQKNQVDGAVSPSSDYRPKLSSPLGARPVFSRLDPDQASPDDDLFNPEKDQGWARPSSSRIENDSKTPNTHVTVGISRLHVVEMPSLKMGPIYWDPVHDVSSVVRGTWFYKDTMWPVESELANQIEEGYEYMKPWTPTYVDELNSCVEIGPEAEVKIAHKIWPAEEPHDEPSRPGTAKSTQLAPEELERHEAKTAASKAGNKAAGKLQGFEPPGTGRLFARSSIIYVDARDAQILKPSQLPSAARGRKPLAQIRKGRTVGIPIVRGFDMKIWEKINPLPNRAITKSQTTEGLNHHSIDHRKPCLACISERPTPTDLVLVIHGIGQKLSERVESFHFTHAINAFRRQVNVELNAEAVKPWLREDLGSVMVLPINWRSTLKLEDGGPEPDPNRRQGDTDPMKNQFTLKDITAESLPAVRNLISDVMLDIPYYLSHHKPKMVEAVITEANRVYRRWCINNPGFHESGRVHLLAHSLGSVMALDILSKQPTKLPQQVDYPPRDSTSIRNDMLEFDTKNLFFCGSPAGFFLLLNRASLIPRKGRDKPDADGEDTNAGVAGQAGTFGCLAVDNLYNIMHYNDPVAYRLNACVDVDYAASLQAANVPSALPGWGQYLGSYFRGKAVAPSKAMTGLNELPRRPTTARLPTSVEMETHDFSKEEIAEKRMFLLNDNGQIDYTLRSGGGPLEIQYLNMLSAHSSYWILQDFVRFLVVEVGRKPGKSETLSGLKAVKKMFGKK